MNDIVKLLGAFPVRVDLEARVVEQVDCGSFIREKVAYNVEAGERISAYICIPKHLQTPAPAVFCHHQHNCEFDFGKSEVVGLIGDPDQAYAKELAEKGFITFAPDAIAFEERNWSKNPGRAEYFELSSRLVRGKTLMAKVLHDVSVGLDCLLSRPEVDPERVGFIGHSYGGRMALWAPAFDRRIRASVSNCGCIDYRNSLTHDTGIQMEFCIPGFMEKYDLEDVVGCFQDCPLLISATTDDKWSRGYEHLFDAIKAMGQHEVELKIYSGLGHVFTSEMRDYAYSFLKKKLMG
ncbi:MAG: dienelactone hydrolase family protein [Chlamydiia bacterium]